MFQVIIETGHKFPHTHSQTRAIYTDEKIYQLKSIPEWVVAAMSNEPNMELLAIKSCREIDGILVKAETKT